MLVAEDEALIAFALSDELAAEGYRSVVASTADEVGSVLTRQRPAVAIVDMRLRDGMTGPDIARRLNELGVPVIIHSGEAADSSRLSVFSRVPKPAVASVVVAEVIKAVAREQSTPAA